MPTLRFSIVFSLILLLLAVVLTPKISISQFQPAVEFTYRGDINEDGQLNIFDLLEMLGILTSEPESDRQRQIANVDKSADGDINIFDLLAILSLLAGGEPEIIYWGPAIAGLNPLSAATGDTVAITVINFDESIAVDQCRAYIDEVEVELIDFSLDSISIVIPEGFTGGEVSLIVAADTTNSKYLNLQIREQVEATAGGTVTHPDGASIDIPAGALQADAAITVVVPTENQLEAMDISADAGTTIVLFGPSGTGFTEPVTVALPWPNSATEADSLGAQYYDETEGAWKAIGTVDSDPEQRLIYVQTDRLAAFKSVKTQVVRVRVLTTSRWATFRLVSGGAMRLHHLISVSEEITDAVVEKDSIYLSQLEAGEIYEGIVEIVVDMSFNVPDMSEELEFSINRSRDERTWTHVALANYLNAEPNNRENFWWGGFKESDQPNSKTVKIAAAELFNQSPARVPPAVDATTLDMKVLFGYQGWFLCPGDGSDVNVLWYAWAGNGPAVPENLEVDYWPDVSELSPEERFATEMALPDGSPAELYSNYLRKTTVRHFKWMEDYDLDGVWLQRFITSFDDPKYFCFRNKVLQNVRAGAEAHGRVFAIEYDGVRDPEQNVKDELQNDWTFLVDVLKINESPNYLHHKGKPVFGIWGINPLGGSSLAEWLNEEADPKYHASLYYGCGTYLEHKLWSLDYFDVISAWSVVRYLDIAGADEYRERYMLPDMEVTSAAGVGYMPVIWPGFSHYNGTGNVFNNSPRYGGMFYWHQAYNAISAGAKMIKIAMFDEVNEGTAMYKQAPTVAELPVGAQLVPLDIDGYAVPSDWYLQLARETGRMLRGEIPLSPEFPLDLPDPDPEFNWGRDTTVIEEITTVSIPGGTFEMGSENGTWKEKPVHTVTVSSFQMSQYEITNAQYAAYLNATLEEDEITATTSSVTGVNGDYNGLVYIYLAGNYNSYNKCWISFDGSSFTVEPGKENLPVVYVTWYGARAFAIKYGFDLPTEAEWEYACRGAQQYEYGTDDGTISSAKANYDWNIGHTTYIGTYPANPFGLYDMSGNVEEWCSDWYGDYSSESQINPQGPDSGDARVKRGGVWYTTNSHCRSANRRSHFPADRTCGYGIGFRVVQRP